MESARQSLLVVLVAVGVSAPLSAQNHVAKSEIATARVVAGPASLNAVMARYGAVLQFTPVPNAAGYKVTRVSYPGSPEAVVYEGGSVNFRIASHSCLSGKQPSSCIFVDTNFRTAATSLTVTYRVYGILDGPAGRAYTPSSPPASLVWNCPDCPPVP